MLEKRIALSSVAVTCKLSWAANRKTKRIEDTAYCLVGILDIPMTQQYGEGSKAFTRLQEEALKSSDDISALVWGMGMPWSEIRSATDGSVLSISPVAFRQWPKGSFQHFRHGLLQPTTITGHGLQVDLPEIRIDQKIDIWLGIVDDCAESRGADRRGIALVLRRVASGPIDTFERALGCPPVLIEPYGMRRLVYKGGRSAIRTVYLRGHGSKSGVIPVHAVTGSRLARYMRLTSSSRVRNHLKSWGMIKQKPVLLRVRKIEPPKPSPSNVHGAGFSPDVLEQSGGASLGPFGRAQPRPPKWDFCVNYRQLYEKGFRLHSAYPPLGSGHEIIQDQDFDKETHAAFGLTRIVCQGPPNYTFISVLASAKGGRCALRFDIDWEDYNWRATCSTWHSQDTAIIGHSNTEANPMLHQRGGPVQ